MERPVEFCLFLPYYTEASQKRSFKQMVSYPKGSKIVLLKCEFSPESRSSSIHVFHVFAAKNPDNIGIFCFQYFPVIILYKLMNCHSFDKGTLCIIKTKP